MNVTFSNNNVRPMVGFIILFTGFLFFFNIGNRDLWAPDEPRYAQVSKEMRDSGNFIVPHLNSDPYPDKPPLLFWLINVSSLLPGEISPLTARIPSALAGVGCCLAVFFLGRRLFQNNGIALMSALILATSSKFLWMAHRVAFDVILTFFVTLALLCFYRGYTEEKNRGWFYLLFYACMALGVLAKGPIGFILPFCTVVTYLIVKRDAGALKSAKPWIGAAIFLAIVFSWVGLAVIYGGKEYTHQILFKQNVGRFASSFAHKRPFYYFFINFPLNFMPWSPFIPGVAAYAFSRKGREKRPLFLLPAIWFAVIFIFFSITSGKRDIYVLPLYPAAALLTAWFLHELKEQAQGQLIQRLGNYPCYILCGAAFLLAILFPITVYHYLPEYCVSTIPFEIILIAGGVVMLRSLKQARTIFFTYTLNFVILASFAAGTVWVIPPLNRYKSAREICDKAVAMMKPGDPLAMFNCFGDPYLFYTNNSHIQVMRRLDELQQFLHSPERVFLFIQEKDFKSLSKSLEMPVFVLEKDSVGHRDILFVSNKDI